MLKVVAVVLVSVIPANAADLDRMFGHTISVEGEHPDRVIKIDGRETHKNAILSFQEMIIIDGVPALIGSSSNGGNACDGTPFVVSFPQGGRPRFDGPLEACAIIHHEVLEDKVVFSTNDIPGQGRERWSWTPEEGFKELGVTAFAPDDKSGWQALRERSFQHPSDVLKNAEISATLKSLLGQDFDTFQKIITGTGSGEFKNDDFVGETCSAHRCGDEEALLFLSAKDRQPYVAWKPDGQKIVVHPPVQKWPEKARQELRWWANKWK